MLTERETRHWLEFQHLAAATATALATARTETAVNTAIDQCLRRLGCLFAVDRGYLLQFSADAARMSNTHEWCAEGVETQIARIQEFSIDTMRWWKTRLWESGVVHVPRVDALPPEAAPERDEFQRQAIQSLVNVAMYGMHGTLTGFIGYDSVARERTWSDDELAMLRTIAGILGAALERARTEATLEMERNQLLSVFNSLEAGIYLADPFTYELLYVNDYFARILGADSIGQPCYRVLQGLDAPCAFCNNDILLKQQPEPYRWEYYNPHVGRHYVLVDRIIRWSDGRLVRMEMGLDITERKTAEEQLRQAASVFEHANEGIMIADPEGAILDVNAAFSRITGYRREEVLGRNPRLLQSGRHDRSYYSRMWRTLQRQGHWTGEIWNRRKNGEIFVVMQTISTVRDADGQVQRYVALLSDISAQKAQQRQLEQIAHYDALTGLPNRVLFAEHLRQSMARALRRGTRIAVAYLDLDGFKAINDTHGHDAGDRLLVTVAERMKETLREVDILARLGGDEFVAVLDDLPGLEDCLPLLRRLLNAAAEPVHDGDRELQVSASLGISLFPQAEPIDADQLLRQADQAMYQAKLDGKNRYHLFDTAHDRELRGRHEERERIRQALANQEFVLYYQPKVNMRHGTVMGAEALLRWRHPERGVLPPGVFLPLLENHALMVELGDWVIDTALVQITAWRAAGMDLRVSVNVDALQLNQEDFIDKLRAAFARHPMARPGDLELELLETSTLRDIAQVSAILRAGQSLGVSFSLDDFGTGYSSLSYLKRLPVETLKIDQSFVRDMLDDPDDLAILEGVISLAEAFRRQVIAEGVETAAHGEMLLQLGCELGQGYAIARPMPAAQIPAWHARWQPSPVWSATQPIARNRLPALFALVEHRAWVVALSRYLRDEQTHPPPLEARRCHFGQWLNTQIQHGLLDAELHAHLASLHGRLHQQANELVRLKQQGESAIALAGLGAIDTLHEAVIQALRRLLV